MQRCVRHTSWRVYWIAAVTFYPRHFFGHRPPLPSLSSHVALEHASAWSRAKNWPQTHLYRSDDAREGYTAFTEKRTLTWIGR